MLPLGSEWDSDSAGERAAARAPVTPRVYAPHSGEPLPLADCVRRLIDRNVKGVVCLHGPPGSGKTTALRHLKAVLPKEICPHVVDGPAVEEHLLGIHGLTIYTDHSPASVKNAVQLQMAAWSQDDCIEYLLAAHPARCASVMSRIRSLPNPQMLDGRPELWRILLDAFAHDDAITDVAVALRMAAAPLLTLHGGPIGLFCLESLCQGHDLSDYPELGLPTRAGRLVRHRPVQLVLAADRIVEQLCDRRGVEDLTNVLPEDLINEVARLARFWPSAVEQVKTLIKREVVLAQAMAVSVQVALDKSWRPTHRLRNLASAVLRGANWQRADLSGSILRKAQFDGADLRYAKLRFAQAEGANFPAANLRFALLRKLNADAGDFTGADLSHARGKRLRANGATFDGARFNAGTFTRADLRGSSMRGARFIGAQLSLVNFTHCDLTDADFTDADLRRVLMDDCDLSVATFDRARFSGGSLRNCNLAGMYLLNADFSGAVLASSDLTGSTMPRANFENAVLCNAGLAEVDWEGANLRYADLRNASFHLGSTRSGLVGSNVPCEGSRTGFYTDDFNEQDYKPAEEIRKANLCGADLRGANVEGVDFYLVDLRGATYTADQREHFKVCGAILHDRDD